MLACFDYCFHYPSYVLFEADLTWVKVIRKCSLHCIIIYNHYYGLHHHCNFQYAGILFQRFQFSEIVGREGWDYIPKVPSLCPAGGCIVPDKTLSGMADPLCFDRVEGNKRVEIALELLWHWGTQVLFHLADPQPHLKSGLRFTLPS